MNGMMKKRIVIATCCVLAHFMAGAQQLSFFKGDNGKYGCKDTAGTIVIPAKYDGVNDELDGLVHIKGKWGFVDLRSGYEAVEPRYDMPFHLEDGFASVRYKGKWGALDDGFYVTVEPKYDEAFVLRDSFATVCYKGKWGYIDHRGFEFVEPRYDKALDMRNGYSEVYLKGRWGLVNSFGYESIPPRFDSGSRISNGMARVSLNGKWGYVNEWGRVVVPIIYDWASDVIGDDRLEVRLDRETFHITRTGKRIGFDKYHRTMAGTDLIVYEFVNGKIGFKDQDGDIVVYPKYIFLGAFEQGLAPVRNEVRYWGLIDAEGREVVPPKYTEIHDFNEYGIAEVALNNRRGFIDRNGYEVIPVEYSFFARINRDGLIVAAKWVSGGYTNRYGVLNTAGEIVVPFDYDDMQPMSHGIAAVKRNNKYGFVNSAGEEIVPVIYDSEAAALAAGNAKFGND